MTSSTLVRLRLPVGGLCLLAVTVACSGGSTATPKGSPALPAGASTGPSSTGLSTGPSSTDRATPNQTPSSVGTSSTAGQAPVPVESNPPGDIPDSIAFVTYHNTAGSYRFTYPEGWARTETGTAVRFTDKLNGIEADSTGAPAAPTPDTVRGTELARLQLTQPAFELVSVEAVTLPAGSGVRLIYRRNSAPDPVTGRQIRDEVESYLIAGGGRSLRLDLFGPVGADNVDAYRTISRSLALS